MFIVMFDLIDFQLSLVAFITIKYHCLKDEVGEEQMKAALRSKRNQRKEKRGSILFLEAL